MQLALDFKTIEQQHPKDKEYCLIILNFQSDVIHSAAYIADEDAFYIDDVWCYFSDQILYWTKASF